MRFTCLALVLPIAAMLLFGGCKSNTGQDETEIPADIVHNPNSANGDAEKGSLPVITFETLDHDFGRILEGETVSYEFSFSNTGKTDLLLAEVTTSCGCTIPSYSKAPIRPNGKGVIKVTFNSQGRRGFQTKNIIVASNTQPNTVILRIKAQVVNPSAEN
jgi:hypothetical protein